MKHKIALLADVHGNSTALKSVIEDSIQEGVTDYWFLGDLIMPGPGTNELFEILNDIKVSTYVKGNWEDSFLDVLNKNIDFNNATDIYVSRLVQYQCENLNENYINLIKNLPLQLTKQVNNLSISISHNLQNKIMEEIYGQLIIRKVLINYLSMIMILRFMLILITNCYAIVAMIN